MTTSIITRGSGVSVAGRRSRGLSPAFSRASAAYQSDGRKVGVGVPRFETVDGRRGVLVEEGTTNLLAAPNAIDGSDWDKANSTAGYVLPVVTLTGDTYSGARVFAVTLPTNLPDNQWTLVRHLKTGQVLPAGTYTAIICCKAKPGLAGKKVSFTIYGPTGGHQGASFVLSEAWQRLEIQVNNSTSQYLEFSVGKHRDYVVSGVPMGAACTEFYVCAPQLEAKPYATSFADGTRKAEALVIPIGGALDMQEGTVECWVSPNWPATVSAPNRVIVSAFSNGNTNGYYWLGYNTSKAKWGVPDAGLRSSAQAFLAHTWFHLALTWDSGTLKLYVNGEMAGSVAKPLQFSLATDALMRIGHFVSAGNEFDGSISNLRLHRRALSDEEIAAHAAGNIVARDCYHYPFDGDLWPAPGSLGAVVAPSIITRPGKLEVIRR